ncbi:hypothetical protein PMIN06_006178 [Paraphaeosphaeria minitans]|uniref:Uncharacterized protein n=1 Tax=Paraphaeosphaeria minitans TaxID=565426 RepID=A0A9P6GGP1_9PLEO|nr:hypothetical protein PMIN01_07573 [Paraphaeosphaeria minitans]
MLIKTIIATAAAVLPITLAAPTNSTRALTISSSPKHLEARGRFCINCENLCHNARNLHETYACTAVCYKTPDNEMYHIHVIDGHECLNSKERKKLALNLFRDQTDYINMMGKHEIKSFLRSHMDSSILHGSHQSTESVSRLIDTEFESFSYPPSDGIMIDCKVMCGEALPCAEKQGIFAEYAGYSGSCAAVCPYRPDNQQHCIKTLNNGQVLSLFKEFDPLGYTYRYPECMKRKGEERKKCFEDVIYGECPDFEGRDHPGAKYCR